MADTEKIQRRPTPFSRNLDKAMKEQGLRNRDVGRLLDVGDAAISNWRNGWREPVVMTAAALAIAVGRSLDELVAEPEGLPPIGERVLEAREIAERGPGESQKSAPSTEPPTSQSQG